MVIMYDTPVSLQGCCVDYICDNLSMLCDVQASPDSPQTKLTFKDADVFFHYDISEQLIQMLCEKGKLTDETLSLFDPSVTNLKRVCIKDANISTKGLRNLKAHKVSDLEVCNLKNMTVNDIIGCLGEWSLTHLRSLNVTNCTFIDNAKFCVVVSLSKLRNLQSLNVSNTEFNNHGLEVITEDLPCLENLDISGTFINSISSLKKCKKRLKSLSMYNLRTYDTDEVVTTLCDMEKLLHLDISDDFSSVVQPYINNISPAKFSVSSLLERTHQLPSLSSLDISGRDDIKEDLIRDFIDSHKKLKFLGLALTHACEYDMFKDATSQEYQSDLLVTGEANERQIFEALRRYASRGVYIQRALYRLFSRTQDMSDVREDVIQLVLPAMTNHSKQLGVQMAGTACLYNLSKGDIGKKVHPLCLQKIVGLTLKAMENFPNIQQLQKNALLTLCNDRILQDVSFNRYHCAQLVMECLCSFDDSSMNRMSVAICSILAAKISTEQTSVLGAKSRYMKKMLQLVKQKIDNQQVDITLKFTLSALWNLTDESPPTCHVFLNEGGLELFMNTLQVVADMDSDSRAQVETKILGLLNNIAEVKELRHFLMREDFIMVVKGLLQAQQIDVCYFAAGIVAHLASDGVEAWLICGTPRSEILSELLEVVLKWQQPQGEMVAYRSFSPFFPLLTSDAAPVQLWAGWAIQHVCTKNSDRYCHMLEEQGGADILKNLQNDPATDSNVVSLVTGILNLINEQKQKTS